MVWDLLFEEIASLYFVSQEFHSLFKNLMQVLVQNGDGSEMTQRKVLLEVVLALWNSYPFDAWSGSLGYFKEVINILFL